jgi:hypothetical protein
VSGPDSPIESHPVLLAREQLVIAAQLDFGTYIIDSFLSPPSRHTVRTIAPVTLYGSQFDDGRRSSK